MTREKKKKEKDTKKCTCCAHFFFKWMAYGTIPPTTQTTHMHSNFFYFPLFSSFFLRWSNCCNKSNRKKYNRLLFIGMVAGEFLIYLRPDVIWYGWLEMIPVIIKSLFEWNLDLDCWTHKSARFNNNLIQNQWIQFKEWFSSIKSTVDVEQCGSGIFANSMNLMKVHIGTIRSPPSRLVTFFLWMNANRWNWPAFRFIGKFFNRKKTSARFHQFNTSNCWDAVREQRW